MRHRLLFGITLIVLIGLAVLPGAVRPAAAASIVVNTLTDDNASNGLCSLREAIQAANTDAAFQGCSAGSGADIITFSVTGTVSLGSGRPSITSALTIDGPGASSLTVQGVSGTDVFTITGASAVATIQDISITGGRSGVRTDNDSTATLKRVEVFGNTGDVGVYNNVSTMFIYDSAIYDNDNAAFGGGVLDIGTGAALTMVNTTVANNDAASGGSGSGVLVTSQATATIRNSTIAGNSTGASASQSSGLYVVATGTVSIYNSIVSGNTGGAGNCYTSGGGVINDFGANLESAANCGLSIQNSNPNLGSLTNNGGAVKTMAITNASSAYNVGTNGNLPTDAGDCDSDSNTAETLPCDARADSTNFPRNSGGTVDLGAFEVVTAVAPVITDEPDSQTIPSGTTASLSVVATGTGLSYQWYQGNSGNTSTPVGTNSASFTTPTLISTTSYWVRVSNAGGSDDSATATITVYTPNFVVDRIDDANVGVCSSAANDCTLRGAMNLANTLTGTDTITFSVNGTINLAGVLPDITSDMTIDGPGASSLTVRRDTGGSYRIFNNNGVTATIDGLTISNGNLIADGAGIFNRGNLTVTASVISGNSSNNQEGAGIYNDGNLRVVDTTLSGNTTSSEGAAIFTASNRTTRILNSTLTGNSGISIVTSFGTGTTILVNSTVSGNTGRGVSTGGTSYLVNSTVTGNTSHGLTINGTVTLRNTIVAGNTTDCIYIGGAYTRNANNLLGASCSPGANDISTTDPMLGGLANNGGLTQTHALLTGSPALNAGNNSYLSEATLGVDLDGDGNTTDTLTTDQRGSTRIVNTTVDIGAYESQTIAPVITDEPDAQTIPSGTTANLSVVATGTGLSYQWYQGNSGDTSTPVGTNSASFTTPTLTSTTSYWVRVSNAGGSDDSATATITVYTPDFVVDRIDDANISVCSAAANDCTLRGAINLANTLAGTDTITFDSGVFATPQIIQLTGELPDIASNMTIDGLGADIITVRRNTGGIYRIFTVNNVTVTIDGLTITNGFEVGSGGGIYNALGILTITNSTISGNTAFHSPSSAYGGGITNFGTLTIVNSTISGNTATTSSLDSSGGGIYNAFGMLTVINSTISGNTATSDFVSTGGGISNHATLTLAATTISNNTSSAPSGNAGGGIYNGGTLNISNTIIANSVNGDCYNSNTINASGVNLVEDGSCSISDALSGDPMLNGLANNGGTVMTHALMTGSPALNAGSNALLPADTYDLDGDSNTAESLPVDARGVGFARVVNGTVDIGAYESQTIAPVITDEPDNQTIISGTTANLSVVATGTGLSYQWYQGNSGDTSTPVGTDSASFTTPTLTSTTDYWVRVSNAGGSDDSATATITIYTPDFVVDRIDDTDVRACSSASNDCTLRGAMNLANTLSGTDTITFNASGQGTINLSSALPTINTDMIIDGPGTALLTVNGGSVDGRRPFTVTGGTVMLQDMSITNGVCTSACPVVGNSGGAIYNHGGTMTVQNSIISGSSAGSGGGINNAATLTVVNTTISGNTALGNGGGLRSLGTLTVVNSTISGNTAQYGGGVVVNGGTAQFVNVTISGNTATGVSGIEGGGAIDIFNNATVTIANSTIVYNAAPNFGGLLSGILFENGSLTVSNSIVAHNGSTTTGGTNNCFGAITDGGGNLDNGTSCGFGVNSLSNTDPLLVGTTPANNGGSVATFALQMGSPALNTGLNAQIGDDLADLDGDLDTTEDIPYDARGVGFARVVNGTVDIGAYESQTIAPVITDEPDSQTIPSGTTASLSVVATGMGLSYQWYQGSSGDTSTPVGTNSASFTTPTLTSTTDYWVRVSNAGGSDDSATATITVYTPDFVVDRIDDTDVRTCSSASNDCTLRGAINLANTLAGTDTITFDSGVFATPQIIQLTGVLPDISTNMIIDGLGADRITVRRNTGGEYRIFNVGGVTATIDGLTISNGSHNAQGGGIYNSGSLTVTASVISGNSSVTQTGGGIYNDGTLWIYDSTLSGNTASNHGTAVYTAINRTTRIINSTITGNTGASTIVNVGPSTLLLVNSTISGNNGIGVATGGVLYVISSTITGNTPTGLTVNGSTILRNTIVAGNTTDCNHVAGTFSKNANNLLSASCSPEANDISTTTPMLGGLANNGGLTQTHALLTGSPALNAGNNSYLSEATLGVDLDGDGNTTDTLTTDQRGGSNNRIVNTTVDIGAFESQTIAPVITDEPDSQNIPSATTTTLSVVASGTGLSYQWYQGSSGDTSTPVGTDSASFTTPTLTSDTNYWVRVSNDGGNDDSATAVITVYTPDFVVDRTDDPTLDATNGVCSSAANDCTLRGAVMLANSLSGTDTITFDAAVFATPQTIPLGTELAIIEPVTIDGLATADRITLNGGNSVRVFSINTGTTATPVTIQDLTILDGNYPEGAGITNEESSLVVTNVHFNSNQVTGAGGGLRNIADADGSSAIASLTDVVFSGNSASAGGAISNEADGANSSATLTVENATFSNNANNGGGGGLQNRAGGVSSTATTTIVNATFDGNLANAASGAIGNNANTTDSTATVTAINVTMSGNQSGVTNISRADGAVATVTLYNATITGNTAPNPGGDGLDNFSQGGTPTILAYNTLLADNDDLNCSGSGIILGADSISDDASCTGATIVADAALTLPALADNGGSVMTHALVTGSPAINAGNSALLPADSFDLDGDTITVEPLPVDARGIGFPRVSGLSVDVGAYEAAIPPGVTVSEITPNPMQEGGTATYSIILDAPPNAGETVRIQPRGFNSRFISVSPSQLVFTDANWNIAQVITITAPDDPVNRGVRYQTLISHLLTTNGAAYAGIPVDNLRIVINDNDLIDEDAHDQAYYDALNLAAWLEVTPGAIPAGAANIGATVRLNGQPMPGEVVVVNLYVGAGVTVSPSQLVFTEHNWDIAQPVTLIAAAEGNTPLQVVVDAAATTSPEFVGAAQAVSIQILPAGVSNPPAEQPAAPFVPAPESTGETSEGSIGE